MFAVVTLTTVMARAQSGNPQDGDDARQLAARCAYTSEDSCAKPSSSSRETLDIQIAQAQFPGRAPRFGPRTPYPYGPNPFAYGRYGNGRKAALGGLIGFGAGFALGAAANHNSNTRVGSGLIVGTLGAVFGASIGHGVAPFPYARFHHRWRESGKEDEEASSGSSHQAGGRNTQQSPHAGN